MNGIIYCYISPNGKKYIGQTWDEERRKGEHRRAKGGCTHFHYAIKKYGFDNFQYYVLHKNIKNQSDLDKIKANEIIKNNSIHPFGYNLKISGQCGIVSDEMRMKMSKAQKGRKHNKETKEKMSAWQIGKKLSEETKKKISAAHAGRKRIMDFESKCKKPVRCIETGIVYKTIKDAGISIGYIDGCAISRCLRGKSKTSGGYHWEYVIA